MLFNSYIFIFQFLPVALIGYFSLNRLGLFTFGKIWLLFASLFFYAWWNIFYLPLLLASIIVNFSISNILIRISNYRKPVFIVGILFNIGLLGYYKYANFFVENINTLLAADIFIRRIALPLAISFFTLQQIAYLVDVYEGLAEERSIIDYGLFVAFFPQLIAGPIVHHGKMMPQFKSNERKQFNPYRFTTGLYIFSLGLFKKVVIADNLAHIVNKGYSISDGLSMIDAWVCSLGFTFQIYFDFSGYADMAIGLGLMFNIFLPKNFDSPYRATNIINYWDRWHITLSRFIYTYVYTPILKYFPGKIAFAKAMVATMLAMIVSGIWHGAAWTFVIWGAFHGLGLMINHSWKRYGRPLPKWLAWVLTFLSVNASLVIFRAQDLSQILNIYSSMLSMGGSQASWYVLQLGLDSTPALKAMTGTTFDLLNALTITATLVTAMLICAQTENSGKYIHGIPLTTASAIKLALLLATPLMMMNQVSEFIYFRF